MWRAARLSLHSVHQPPRPIPGLRGVHWGCGEGPLTPAQRMRVRANARLQTVTRDNTKHTHTHTHARDSVSFSGGTIPDGLFAIDFSTTSVADAVMDSIDSEDRVGSGESESVSKSGRFVVTAQIRSTSTNSICWRYCD